MSTHEYYDLFLNCQSTGLYHMFTFDIKDSKKMDTNTRYNAQMKLIQLMKSIYQELEKIQKESGKKILVFDDDFVTFDSRLPIKGLGMKQEPFLLGDVFGFTIFRDSIDKVTILDIYDFYKENLNIDFDFHLADGFYETNDYSLGSTKLFRGYCMDILSNYHKFKTADGFNRLKLKK